MCRDLAQKFSTLKYTLTTKVIPPLRPLLASLHQAKWHLSVTCIQVPYLTRESGILSLLEEGDEIMADKSFLIKDLLSETHVSLVIPPFLGPSRHFSPEVVRQTRAIARLRIHVERAIRRTKVYHKFDRVLPMTLVGSVNQLWTVCTLLSNFQGPLF